MSSTTCILLPSNEETWEKLPKANRGAGRPLPSWAKAVAVHLPRTAAAMLVLDHTHRTKSPIDPVLWAKMRWVIARENRCSYSQAYAIADLKRAGGASEVSVLTGPPEKWPESDREPLEFARLMTVDAPSIPDDLFQALRDRYGERVVAAMVLLAAYGNFLDRVVLGLHLPLEKDGPYSPLDVAFVDGALQVAPVMPAQDGLPAPNGDGQNVVARTTEWSKISFDELQTRLERQRSRQPRLPVPKWEDIQGKLPPAMATHPTRIAWSLTAYGYAVELQVPWQIATRTMWSELPGDRIFEESLFWIQTRAIQCNYCMGHCEMLLEVAGLDKEAVADRTRHLAGDDWSVFPPQEQRAYDYARRLSQQPWTLTCEDYATLEKDFGAAKAMSTFWWLCRGLYMTRISDGFQLPLERENVFAPPPKK
jgi:alkylhydroperoxidase family enzyme